MIRTITGLNSLFKSNSIIPLYPSVKVGRVSHVILNNKENPEIFEKFGGWGSIGGILFTGVNEKTFTNNLSFDNFALPLFPNFKLFPIINEIVYLIPFPIYDSQKNVSSIKYYYITPISIWNNSHHNALPDLLKTQTQSTTSNPDYEQVEGGFTKKPPLKQSQIYLGSEFEEKNYIKPIQPFEGDIIFEGRWGQSLRFGSTIKKSKIFNPWSSVGENGDPITIIRNYFHKDNLEKFYPQVEDINKDDSSIYFTSTQLIPINVSSKNYSSYHTPPISPDKYKDPQIIISSSRILINSKKDSILFSSAKSISLNSKESVNIDSPQTTISSKEIFLGAKEATEPIILGDTFLKDFQKLLNQIISLGTSLQSPIGTPVPYVANLNITVPAVQVTESAKVMLKNLQNYKSKTTKSK